MYLTWEQKKWEQAIDQKKIILTLFVKRTGPLMGKGMASLMKMKIQDFLYFALKMKNKNVFPSQFSSTAYFLKLVTVAVPYNWPGAENSCLWRKVLT